jgi:hypothetical protein
VIGDSDNPQTAAQLKESGSDPDKDEEAQKSEEDLMRMRGGGEEGGAVLMQASSQTGNEEEESKEVCHNKALEKRNVNYIIVMDDSTKQEYSDPSSYSEEEGEGPQYIRGGDDAESESTGNQEGKDNLYDRDYNQSDEVASNEGRRIWDENFEREWQQADNIEQLFQLAWSRQEVEGRNWQGAEEEDDHTAGEREEDENLDEDDSQGSDMSDVPDGMVVVFRPGLGQMLARPPPTRTSPTNINDPNVHLGWGRPRPRFADLLPDQNAEVEGPVIPPPLGSQRRILLGGDSGELTTAPSPVEMTSTSTAEEVLAATTAKFDVTTPSQNETHSTQTSTTITEAEASTVFNEASNGPRQTTRVSVNSGSVASGSESDNNNKKQKYPGQCNKDEVYGLGERMK